MVRGVRDRQNEEKERGGRERDGRCRIRRQSGASMLQLAADIIRCDLQPSSRAEASSIAHAGWRRPIDGVGRRIRRREAQLSIHHPSFPLGYPLASVPQERRQAYTAKYATFAERAGQPVWPAGLARPRSPKAGLTRSYAPVPALPGNHQ